MKLNRYYGLLGLAVAVTMFMTIAACSKGGQEKGKSVEQKATTSAQTAQDFISEQRKTEVETLSSTFDEFSKKFEEFSQRNAYVFTEKKRNLVSDIEKAQTQIEKDLVQARTASEETWQKIKSDATATMEKLQQAMIDFES